MRQQDVADIAQADVLRGLAGGVADADKVEGDPCRAEDGKRRRLAAQRPLETDLDDHVGALLVGADRRDGVVFGRRRCGAEPDHADQRSQQQCLLSNPAQPTHAQAN
ncbi:hypothetical protein [Collimonas humicola]|uniref:hypothetical protein n=1 Tax=Collimonas humicola TaxID=2825886 RepID=UPI002E79543D|nr:hypothetical protein [Collimonas humicola]